MGGRPTAMPGRRQQLQAPALVLALVLAAAAAAHARPLDAKPNQCQNGIRDDNESDVDCSGPCSRRCALNQACKTASDCASGTCGSERKCICPGGLGIGPDGKTCILLQALCYNSRHDAAIETDFNCGGVCYKKCVLQQRCNSTMDCISGLVCIPAPGSGMSGGNNSSSSSSTAGRCGLPGPGDASAAQRQAMNASEALLRDAGLLEPCGRNAWRCALGDACRFSADCASGLCSSAQPKKCVCPPGLVVSGSGACVSPPRVVQEGGGSSCSNGRLDGDEVDADCGGPTCPGCPFGFHCKSTRDCAAGICNSDHGICMCSRGQVISQDGTACFTPQQLCYNQAWDPGESDEDCGGGCVARCGIGKSCFASDDCGSGLCTDSVCVCPPGLTASADGLACTAAKVLAAGNGTTAGAVPNTTAAAAVATATAASNRTALVNSTAGSLVNMTGAGAAANSSRAAANSSRAAAAAAAEAVNSTAAAAAATAAAAAAMAAATAAAEAATARSAGAAGGIVSPSKPDVANSSVAATVGNATAVTAPPTGGALAVVNGSSTSAPPVVAASMNATALQGVTVTAAPVNASSTVTVTTPMSGTCDIRNPCSNRGTCLPAPGRVPDDYTCECRGAFAGARCELDCASLGKVPDADRTACV